MRFGLSDLEELPSLKEFEALAREALGSDEGISAGEAARDEWRVASKDPTQNTEAQEEEKELVAEETAATNEGMPAGESDEVPKAAAAGE